MGGVEHWLMARWKADAEFLLTVVMATLRSRCGHYIFLRTAPIF